MSDLPRIFELTSSADEPGLFREWYQLRRERLAGHLPPIASPSFESFAERYPEATDFWRRRVWVARAEEDGKEEVCGFAELLIELRDPALQGVSFHVRPDRSGTGLEELLWAQVTAAAGVEGAEVLRMETWGMPDDPLEAFLRRLGEMPRRQVRAVALDLQPKGGLNGSGALGKDLPPLRAEPFHPLLLPTEFEEALALGAGGLFDSGTPPEKQTYRSYAEHVRNREGRTGTRIWRTMLREKDDRPLALATMEIGEGSGFAQAGLHLPEVKETPGLCRACWAALIERARIHEPPLERLFVRPASSGEGEMLDALGFRPGYTAASWMMRVGD